MKRPPPHPTLQFSLGLTRLRERRFGCDRDERVEPGIERFDARDAGLRQLNWRHFLLSYQCRRLMQLEVPRSSAAVTAAAFNMASPIGPEQPLPPAMLAAPNKVF